MEIFGGKMSGSCLEDVLRVSGRYLEGFWKVSGGCLEDIYGVYELLSGVSGLVKSGQVKSGQVKSG